MNAREKVIAAVVASKIRRALKGASDVADRVMAKRRDVVIVVRDDASSMLKDWSPDDGVEADFEIRFEIGVDYTPERYELKIRSTLAPANMEREIAAALESGQKEWASSPFRKQNKPAAIFDRLPT